VLPPLNRRRDIDLRLKPDDEAEQSEWRKPILAKCQSDKKTDAGLRKECGESDNPNRPHNGADQAVPTDGARGWAMWKTYMETPWTRDGVVRTYVVTMAPEVAGRIVELPCSTMSSSTKATCCW
jgi:hypothetical protein